MLTRLEQADFTWTYRDLWGGTKIGMDVHALKRSIGRFYRFMSFELLSSNIRDIYVKGGAPLEELVMSIPFGGKFVVFDEKNRMAIFAAIDYNDKTNLNEVFVHSIYILSEDENKKVYCEAENKGLFKVLEDGSVQENPLELVRKPK